MHAKARASLCIRLCRTSLNLELKRLSHRSQEKGSSPVCDRTCWLSLPGLEKRLSQVLQTWRFAWSLRPRDSRASGSDGPGALPSPSRGRRGSVGMRRATLTVRNNCLMPLGPDAPSVTYCSFVGSCDAGGAMNVFCGAVGRSPLGSSLNSEPPSSPSLGFGGGLAISRTFLTRLPYIAVRLARVVLVSAPRWCWLVVMAENISVTLTVWKPFFVFVSHGSRGISNVCSRFSHSDEFHPHP